MVYLLLWSVAGKWVTQEEAFATSQVSSDSQKKGPMLKSPFPVSEASQVREHKSRPPPGPVVSSSLNPMRSSKCAPSSLTVNKRKRQEEKPKAISKEEAAALKAREAAKKRVEEREKSLLGLYGSR